MEKKFVFSVAETADILNVSPKSAYTLFHRKDFPGMLIGKKLCVRVDKLYEWTLQLESTAHTRKETRHGKKENGSIRRPAYGTDRG